MNPISSMNDQERRMLHEVIEISTENNKMLHKLVRAQRWSTFWRLIYWAIVIGSVVAGYYWIEPYISPVIAFFTGQDFSKAMEAIHMLK